MTELRRVAVEWNVRDPHADEVGVDHREDVERIMFSTTNYRHGRPLQKKSHRKVKLFP
jgi:hypothetical protein